MPTLFSYQVPHCEALEGALRRHNLALDASDLGTGKTICSVEIAHRLGFDLIVTGKKIMRPTWGYWMKEWGVDGLITNWELARRRGLPLREKTLYVFDEVHEAGGYRTLNAKLLVNTYQNKLPILMLSATSIESPMRMWALGYLLGFHNLSDYYPWMLRNGVKRNYAYPGHHFNGSPLVLKRLHNHLFPEWGSRMRKAEIPDFPECQYILELVEPAPEDDKSLAKWRAMITVRELEHQNKMEELVLETPWVFNPGAEILPEILFARMRAELGKVPALIEEALAGTREGYSVAIFVNFLPTLDALRTLEFKAAGLIYGDQDPSERATSIRLFQENKTQVIMSTIDSGGAGIDLHDLGGRNPRLAILCPTWRATSLRQALGRVHRAGARSKSIQKLLYCSGSIEEEIASRVRKKLANIDSINDADLAEPEFAVVESGD